MMASEHLDHLPLSRPLAPSPLPKRQGSVLQVWQVRVPRTFGGCACATFPPRAPFRGAARQMRTCRLPIERRPFRSHWKTKADCCGCCTHQLSSQPLPKTREMISSADRLQASFQGARTLVRFCLPTGSKLPSEAPRCSCRGARSTAATCTSDIIDNLLAQNYYHYNSVVAHLEFKLDTTDDSTKKEKNIERLTAKKSWLIQQLKKKDETILFLTKANNDLEKKSRHFKQ